MVDKLPFLTGQEAVSTRPPALWLALNFPRLAVEVFAAPPPAVAVAQQRVVAADTAAEAAGVTPRMRLSSALGLAPGLAACAADPTREAAALEMLACWAGQFSPQLTLVPPHELVLEIGGCLRLFGGLPALLAQVEDGGEAQGFSLRLGLAPTPLAAQWQARAGQSPLTAPLLGEEAATGGVSGRERRVPTSGAAKDPIGGLAWHRHLAALPVTVLDLAAAHQRRLATLGLRRIGQLLALPRAGLARRFGPELMLDLARALGEVPDPRTPFVFPERFAQRLELPARVDDARMLLFAARRLVMALAGWLHARAAGVQEYHLDLTHEDVPPTRLVLGLAGVTRDAERLLRVLRERLDRLTLAAPVTELHLAAEAPQPLAGASRGLFGEAGGEAIAPVVERLRARLGREAVHGLAIVAEHRPECATRAVDWPGTAETVSGGARPLWLLPAPRPLAERDGRPHHDGPLALLTRAERIESGWWDGGEGVGDLRRDYFVALNPRGAWLWVFRDRKGWWLHGHFA